MNSLYSELKSHGSIILYSSYCISRCVLITLFYPHWITDWGRNFIFCPAHPFCTLCWVNYVIFYLLQQDFTKLNIVSLRNHISRQHYLSFHLLTHIFWWWIHYIHICRRKCFLWRNLITWSHSFLSFYISFDWNCW